MPHHSSHPFSIHFEAPSVSTANADLASGSLLSLNNSKTPKTVARKVALLERSRPYSIRIVKRVQLPPLGTSPAPGPEVDGNQANQPLPQQQYYGRLRLGLVEPELRKAEVELVKTWACSHRGERLIELQAAPIPVVEEVHQETPFSSSSGTSPSPVSPVKASEGEEVQAPVFSPPQEQTKSITVQARRAPSKTSKMRKFSMRKKRSGKKKVAKKRGGGKMARSGSKQSQLLKSIEKDSSNFNGEEAEVSLITSPVADNSSSSSSTASSTSITSTGSSSSMTFFNNEAETMEVMASSLAHPAYINQCIVLLEFAEGAESASFAEVITFKVNAVSSQFPVAYRGKLALILEIFAYDLLPMTSSSTTDSNTNLGRSASVSSQASVSAADHRRLDLASWPLFILWPGGAERRLVAEAEKEKERTSKPNLGGGGGGGSLLKIKDEQLEALHDSLQVLPGLGPQGNLPPFYWDLLPGRGLFAAILEAPAITTSVNGISSTLTTLTKGTSYRLRLKCFNFVTGSGVNPVKLRSVVSLRLKGPGINSVADETERFANWTLMNGIGGGSQGGKKGAPPMLDIDLEKCVFSSDPPVAVLDVYRPSGPGQSFSLLWSVVGQRPTEEMIIAFKINVSSEAFFGTSNSNVHFSLTVDTFNESFEGGGRQMDSLGALVDVVEEGPGHKVAINETPVSNSQQPSFSVTLFRTAEEYTVKVMIFVSFEPESLEYRPLLLFNLEVAHFQQSLVALVRKAAPKMLPKIASFIGDIYLAGLPPGNHPTAGKGQKVAISGGGGVQPLSPELIAQLANCHAKALFKCVALFDRDAPPMGGQVDLKLVFQGAGGL